MSKKVEVAGNTLSPNIAKIKRMEQEIQNKNEQLKAQTRELQLLNENLQASEKDLYRTLTESLPIGVFIAQEGEFVFVNPQFQKDIGFTEDELAGTASLTTVHPEDRQFVREETVKKLKGETSSPHEFRTVTKNGDIRVVIETIASIQYKGKRATLGSHMDITERKRMEKELQEKNKRLDAQNEELRATEEELRLAKEKLEDRVKERTAELEAANKELKEAQELYKTLANSSSVGIYIVQDGKYCFVNPQFPKLTGYSEDELLNMEPFELIHHEDRERVRQETVETLKQNILSPLEFRVIHQGGEIHWSMETVTSINYKGKRATLGSFMDITESKQMEQELQEKNKRLDAQNEELRETQEQLVRSEKLAAIGQLAGGVGHELRNPLGAIKNAVYYVREKVAKNELGQKEPRVMEFLDIVDDEINASNKIISDLLGFSRVGKPSVSPTRIEKVIEDALSYVSIPENIELLKKLDTDLPQVEVDADQIRQVVVNLATNATQAMPEGGKLTVTARQSKNFLEVKVSDTGNGIPGDTIGKIFDPLFTTRAKGIGLGLAVCKTIIERHQGQIEVESDVGKGTTFTVKLLLPGKKDMRGGENGED